MMLIYWGKGAYCKDTLVVATKKTGLEVNVDKTQHMVKSGDKNAGRSQFKIENRSFEMWNS